MAESCRRRSQRGTVALDVRPPTFRGFRPSKSPLAICGTSSIHGITPHADDPLEQQTVVLTVPASFDDVARNLTVEAAKKAGLANVSLIEEPQAAFYAWMHTETANPGCSPG